MKFKLVWVVLRCGYKITGLGDKSYENVFCSCLNLQRLLIGHSWCYLESFKPNKCEFFCTCRSKQMHFVMCVRKNVGLEKVQIAHCCTKICCSHRKMLNSKIEQRINLKFLVRLNKAFSESLQALAEVNSKECMSRARIFEWYKRFIKGRTDVEDDECSGRPTTSKTTSNIREI